MVARIYDVAEMAGVSVGTVSNFFNRPDTVSDAAARRIREAVNRLGYVRNRAARNLRAGVSTTVGFVVLNGQNPFFNDVVRGAEDEAFQHGMAILYGNSDESPNRERSYLDLFQDQQVRGVMIAPHGDVTDRLVQLRGAGIASVLIDRFSSDGRLSSVSVDSAMGGRLAADHLIGRGRRRIAFVGGPLDTSPLAERLAGARSAAEESTSGATIEVVSTGRTTVEAGARAGEEILGRPRHQWPDAIFAANDLVALGLLQSLVLDGRILVPREIALVGFDDISFAAGAAVPLSSVRQPSRVIGRAAFRILLEESGDIDCVPRQTVFPPELVVRASSGG